MLPNLLEADVSAFRATLIEYIERQDLDIVLVARPSGGMPSLLAAAGL